MRTAPSLSSAPRDLADAILRVLDAGERLRERTVRWFAANADALSIEGSLEQARSMYAPEGSGARRGRFGKAPPREDRL